MPVSEPIASFTRNHPTTGKKQERAAYTPDEVVQLRADGWAETKPSRGGSATGSGGTSKSTAGSSS